MSADMLAPPSHAYEWDIAGNLMRRADALANDGNNGGFEETFAYDSLDRLVMSTTTFNITGVADDVRYTHYEKNGNIRCFDSADASCTVNNYRYDLAQPHAVSEKLSGPGADLYAYDANGAMTSGPDGRVITWTPFNKPARIEVGGAWSEFAYDPNRRRYRQNTADETTYYVGNIYERVRKTDGTTTHRFHIFAEGTAVAVYSCSTDCGRDPSTLEGGDTRAETLYLHRDHLGSVATISDGHGVVRERFTFTAWGRQQRWNASQTSYEFAYSTTQTRGYTGHEMLDDLDLVHMNGRIYDPKLGRMLSGDPVVGDAQDTQRYNRYTYVNGNPLNLTDPSGYYPKQIMDVNVYTICATDECWKQMGGWSGYNGSAARKEGGISALRDYWRNIRDRTSGLDQNVTRGAFAGESSNNDKEQRANSGDVCVSSSNCLDPTSGGTEDTELSDEERIMQELDRYREAVYASENQEWIDNFNNTDVLYDPNYAPPEGLPEGTIGHGCHACGEDGRNEIVLGPGVLDMLDPNRTGQLYHDLYFQPGVNGALDVIAHEFGHTFYTNAQMTIRGGSSMSEFHANGHVKDVRKYYAKEKIK